MEELKQADEFNRGVEDERRRRETRELEGNQAAAIAKSKVERQ